MPPRDPEPVTQRDSATRYCDAELVLQSYEQLRGYYRRSGHGHTHTQDLQRLRIAPELRGIETARMLSSNSTPELKLSLGAPALTTQRSVRRIHSRHLFSVVFGNTAQFL